MISQHPPKARAGFTLIEILAVIAIVALLAAILFPVFGRARQTGHQARCASNLHQIYLAVRQYREDERGYPLSLAPMMQAGSTIIVSGGGQPLRADPANRATTDASGFGTSSNAALRDEGSTETRQVAGTGLSFLPMDAMRCLSDTEETNGFTSSYDTKRESVWNFYGYDTRGFALTGASTSGVFPETLVNPNLPYDARSNPVRTSLSNRYAPPQTIITHCIYHRTSTSKLSNPNELYNPAAPSSGRGASDVILRLDGSAKLRDVSGFKGSGATPTDSQWQLQNF